MTSGAAGRRTSLVVRSLDLDDARWDVAGEGACLSDAERLRAGRGSPAVLRRRVLVRAGLRRVLGDLLGTAPADVPLHLDRGRPFVPGAGLHCSCSASGAVALLAVSAGGAVGVDVQRHRDDEARAAVDEGWLADAELALLAALPERDRLRATTRAWTHKEAVLKAWGTGLDRLPVHVVTPVADRGRVGGLQLTPIQVRAGHVASVATATAPDAAPLIPLPLPPGGAG
ncbi:4'-phosphopantetheinyl transferase superfamily protein [Modestobacter sp. VKM Ac-2983]|uniref:4'-phosphopantetheinyl transferase family protein n=1 Tax=Modestobacter sp. VKM Ac-2983 TaxID=3004137 RepID=UPI0022ABC138|nr:4'-phosphopantetheinyl transferase superfamily protein [Modestobacter sp. VKM Ac-2983]MCZ2803712.1 4'-phosphopantetheinyl transferase superfamily protein [Modestobacter sp. VKM Ac-2983]